MAVSGAIIDYTGAGGERNYTLFIQLTPKAFMSAAWNAQVWGRETGSPVALNLSEFQRNRVKLKFAYEF